jgi:hypothetical protein
VNGGGIRSAMGVIGLLWCGIVRGLVFSPEMLGGAMGVANFGVDLGFACSSSGGLLCVWWW